MRDNAVFRNDDDAVADVVVGVVHVLRFARWRDHDVITDAGVFVHDRIFDTAISADADPGPSGFFVFDN